MAVPHLSLISSATTPFAFQVAHQPIWASAAEWAAEHTIARVCCNRFSPWPLTDAIHRMLVAIPRGRVVWTQPLSAADAHPAAVAVVGDDPAAITMSWAWTVADLLEDADAAGDTIGANELADLLHQHGFTRTGQPIG
jgi:hypothetical protein